MWARHIESVIGLWIIVSWLIFRYPPSHFDFLIGTTIFLFALITYCRYLRYCHLLNFVVGSYLVMLVFLSTTDIHYAPHQNYMVSGILLMMLALVPSYTKQPPKKWMQFLEGNR